MFKRITWLATAGTLALGMAAAGPSASVHSSAGPRTARVTPGPAVASRAVAVLDAAVVSNAQCGWKPANDTKAKGYFKDNNDEILNGPDCSKVLGRGVYKQAVVVHCGWYDTSGGEWWDYLTDKGNGITGWVPDQFISWTGTPKAC
jgi:hypothetical protein